MPLGNERFAEAICARLGMRQNTGKRGRPAETSDRALEPARDQPDFGF
jgi:hypothetical protein